MLVKVERETSDRKYIVTNVRLQGLSPGCSFFSSLLLCSPFPHLGPLRRLALDKALAHVLPVRAERRTVAFNVTLHHRPLRVRVRVIVQVLEELIRDDIAPGIRVVLERLLSFLLGFKNLRRERVPVLSWSRRTGRFGRRLLRGGHRRGKDWHVPLALKLVRTAEEMLYHQELRQQDHPSASGRAC